MTTPIIPTLDRASNRVLSDPADVIAYLVKFFFTNPGNISEPFANLQVSFRKLNATFGSNAKQMVDQTTIQLQTVINRYYPDGRFLVNVTALNETTPNYTLRVGIVDRNGTPVMVASTTINEDGTVNIQDGILQITPKTT